MENHVLETLERRLDSHGDELDGIEKCLERLTVITERMDATESDHEARLRALEGHGGDMWGRVVQTALSALVGGLIAFALLQVGIG